SRDGAGRRVQVARAATLGSVGDRTGLGRVNARLPSCGYRNLSVEEIPMLRIKQLVPTVALALATATLVTPAAQARLTDVSVGSSPQSLSTHAFSPAHRGPAPGL